MIRKLLPHLILWLGYFMLELGANYVHYGSDRLEALTMNTLLRIPGLMLFTYIIYLVLVPKFRRDLNVGALLLSLLPILVGIYFHRYLITEALIWGEGSGSFQLPLSKVMKNAIKDVSVVAIVTSVLFIRDWWRQEKYMNRLSTELDSSRLALMLQQLQPHFLFNTFNNIYSLIQQDPTRGGESLLRLSGILEYMVHTQIDQKITLEEELEQVQNLIELHRLKYGDSLLTSIEASASDVIIPPMLLLSILENAFKHGDLEDHLFHLQILVAKELGSIHIEVTNSSVKRASSSVYGGKGFAITRELLRSHYGNSFAFRTYASKNRFHVSILIR